MTKASDPKSWSKYQPQDIGGYTGPDKLKWSLMSAHSLKERKEAIKKEVLLGPLITREQWAKTMPYCNLKEHTHITPMLDKDGQVITSKYKYIRDTLKIIEQASGCK